MGEVIGFRYVRIDEEIRISPDISHIGKYQDLWKKLAICSNKIEKAEVVAEINNLMIKKEKSRELTKCKIN